MTDPHLDPTADAGELADRLGPALRAARGTESLREVQARTGISDSALSAYELGRRLPPREFLEVLDAAYHQHGALLASARFDAWEPFGDPATTHRWTIPATWTGPIWCTVRSAREPLHRVLFRWGPWARRLEAEPVAVGRDTSFTMIVNRFEGETADHRVLTCETATPSWVFWATGGPPPELDATDISEGWYPPRGLGGRPPRRSTPARCSGPLRPHHRRARRLPRCRRRRRRRARTRRAAGPAVGPLSRPEP